MTKHVNFKWILKFVIMILIDFFLRMDEFNIFLVYLFVLLYKSESFFSSIYIEWREMICDLFGKEIGIWLYFICLLNYKHSLEDVNTKIMTLGWGFLICTFVFSSLKFMKLHINHTIDLDEKLFIIKKQHIHFSFLWLVNIVYSFYFNRLFNFQWCVCFLCLSN
jgi:hypothetical protein